MTEEAQFLLAILILTHLVLVGTLCLVFGGIGGRGSCSGVKKHSPPPSPRTPPRWKFNRASADPPGRVKRAH